MELNKHAKFFLDGRAMVFSIQRLSLTHHSKSYGNEKYVQTTKFLRKHGINGMNLNTFQRKPLNTLKYVMTHIFVKSRDINKTLQHINDYENNNKNRQNPKIQLKVGEESVQAI